MYEHKILVVDDAEDIRELLSTVLSEAGFNVMTAINGQEALRLILAPNGSSVELILLDLRMPGLDGWGFSHAYHTAVGKPVPIIAITAAADAASWAKQVGAVDFLAKPFSIAEVRTKVAALFHSGLNP